MTDRDPDMSPAMPATVRGTLPGAEPEAAKATGTDWWGELKGIFWLLLAVLGVWSFVAKPFYIPSESMMPTLIKGDRLIVTKYPYGWSYVSPSFHVLPFIPGRLFGQMPQVGDVVILKPPLENADWIKRVVGLPGDRIEVRGGKLWINGRELRRERRPDAMIPIDANVQCASPLEAEHRVTGPDGKPYCALPVYRETLPNGRVHDIVDFGDERDNQVIEDYGPITVPAAHVFVMGDNRDESADSRYALWQGGLGGPIPWENLGGRAEFISFSYDGSTQLWNPLSWFTGLRAHRAGINLHPARASAGQETTR